MLRPFVVVGVEPEADAAVIAVVFFTLAVVALARILLGILRGSGGRVRGGRVGGGRVSGGCVSGGRVLVSIVLALLAANASATVQFALLGDKSRRAFGYLTHIHAMMRGRPSEDAFHTCHLVEIAGSGLDPKSECDGDECSEGFEMHFVPVISLAEGVSEEGEGNECKATMSVRGLYFPVGVQSVLMSVLVVVKRVFLGACL
jgi:hypothetical protein